jgi:uncharacterized protein (DUF58 family)
MSKTKEILRNVQKVELKMKKLVDGLLQGAYHSIFKGRGIEFSEVREYVIGDDVRTIDWNVTARMNSPHVKEFIEERDLSIYIVFDVSSSSTFGSAKEKKESSIEIAASLCFAAMKNNDNVGLFLFTNGVERFVPARKGKRHILKIIREMIYYNPKEKTTNISKTLKYVSKIIKRRSVVFVVSDFQGEMDSRSVRMLKKKHDVIALMIQDPRELEIPDIGYIELEDDETGERMLVDTSDSEFRESYKKLASKRVEHVKKRLNMNSIDIIPLRTDISFEIPLKQFFDIRLRRRG